MLVLRDNPEKELVIEETNDPWFLKVNGELGLIDINYKIGVPAALPVVQKPINGDYESLDSSQGNFILHHLTCGAYIPPARRNGPLSEQPLIQHLFYSNITQIYQPPSNQPLMIEPLMNLKPYQSMIGSIKPFTHARSETPSMDTLSLLMGIDAPTNKVAINRGLKRASAKPTSLQASAKPK